MEFLELQELGLTKSEILVYVALLKIGASSTGKIIKDAGISSGKVYEVLDRLINKGLVTHVLKNNVKHFSAADPVKLEEYWQKKRDEWKNKERSLSDIIPKLRELKKSSGSSSSDVYEGFNGFKTALFSAFRNLPKGSEVLSLGGGGSRGLKIDIVWERIHEICNDKEIGIKFMVNDNSPRAVARLKELKVKNKFLNYKFFPGPHLAPILIFPNQIILLNFEELSAVVVKSSAISRQLSFFFDSLWNMANI